MRVVVIVRHILPFVLSFLRDRRRWIIAGRPVPRTDAFHRARAEALVAAIGTLGPTFVKLAQVFAGRADLFPEPYVRALSTLTDQVPPVPLEAVERTIVESYGKRVGRAVPALRPRADRRRVARPGSSRVVRRPRSRREGAAARHRAARGVGREGREVDSGSARASVRDEPARPRAARRGRGVRAPHRRRDGLPEGSRQRRADSRELRGESSRADSRASSATSCGSACW